MKIGTYSPVNNIISGVRIQRPVKTLLFAIRGNGTVDFTKALIEDSSFKLSVILQNSASGKMDTIIPYIPLGKLAQVATYNEGAVMGINGLTDHTVYIPVMINPSSSVQLGNDKYLDVELHECSHQDITNPQVDIYCIESEQQTDFVTKYSKMAIVAGQARQRFTITDEDMLCFPITGFDEIQLTHKNGSVIALTPVELRTIMASKNDLSGYSLTNTGYLASGQAGNRLFPIFNSYILNLLDFNVLEIIRDSNNSATLEFITGNLVK